MLAHHTEPLNCMIEANNTDYFSVQCQTCQSPPLCRGQWPLSRAPGRRSPGAMQHRVGHTLFPKLSKL